jgi:molybdate transport system substrate-binding protein
MVLNYANPDPPMCDPGSLEPSESGLIACRPLAGSRGAEMHRSGRLPRPWVRVGPILLGVLLVLSTLPVSSMPPAVAAAADLRFALPEVARRFQEETGLELRLSFGSSGNFRRQIAQGAPFELFLSADEDYVFALADAGLTRDRGVLYAVGRLVLFVPNGSDLVLDPALADLPELLQDGRRGRFAIANPAHAPYGRAAREVLRSLALWEQVRPHLVLGENAAQAGQFAWSGSTLGGLIPYALALAPEVSQRGRFVLIPQPLHRPLRQRMVLIRGAGEVAQRFHAYLQTPQAREVLARYGFLLPGER